MTAGSEWSEQPVITPIVIIAGAGGSGLFVYSPTVGAGNLIASITSTSGTDPYGNAYLPGVTSYGGITGGTQAQRAAYQLDGASQKIAIAATAAGPYGTSQLTSNYVISGGVPTVNIVSAVKFVITSGADLTLANSAHSWLADEVLTYKTADESRATTTLSADGNLTLTSLVASGVYDIQGLFVFEGAAAVNFKWDWILGSASDVLNVDAIYNATGGTFQHSSDITSTSGGQNHAAQTLGATSPNAVWVSGTYVCANAATSLTLEWAANAAGTAILKKGSKLTARRIA